MGGHMEGTLTAGDTSISFTNPVFSDSTYFDIYSDDPEVQHESWSFSGTTFTIQYSAQTANHQISIVYKNF